MNAKRGLPFACVSIAVAWGARMRDVEIGDVAPSWTRRATGGRCAARARCSTGSAWRSSSRARWRCSASRRRARSWWRGRRRSRRTRGAPPARAGLGRRGDVPGGRRPPGRDDHAARGPLRGRGSGAADRGGGGRSGGAPGGDALDLSLRTRAAAARDARCSSACARLCNKGAGPGLPLGGSTRYGDIVAALCRTPWRHGAGSGCCRRAASRRGQVRRGGATGRRGTTSLPSCGVEVGSRRGPGPCSSSVQPGRESCSRCRSGRRRSPDHVVRRRPRCPVTTTPATRLYATRAAFVVLPRESIASIALAVDRWATLEGRPSQVGLANTRISAASSFDRIAGHSSPSPMSDSTPGRTS